jgi:hypothetical protein
MWHKTDYGLGNPILNFSVCLAVKNSVQLLLNGVVVAECHELRAVSMALRLLGYNPFKVSIQGIIYNTLKTFYRTKKRPNPVKDPVKDAEHYPLLFSQVAATSTEFDFPELVAIFSQPAIFATLKDTKTQTEFKILWTDVLCFYLMRKIADSPDFDKYWAQNSAWFSDISIDSKALDTDTRKAIFKTFASIGNQEITIERKDNFIVKPEL